MQLPVAAALFLEKGLSWRTRQDDIRGSRLTALAELSALPHLEFSNPAEKVLFVDCPGLCMKSCGHCEGLFNYCYAKPKELFHLLILTDGASTVLFNTRRLSH